MNYECIDDIGYDGRLTKGRVYRTDWQPRVVSGDLGEIVFDDGTTGEVYRERFKTAPVPVTHADIALRDGLITKDEFTRISRGRASGIAEAVEQTRRQEELFKLCDFEEGGKCICSGTWEQPPVEGCTCHCGHPPCSQCVNNELICDTCDRTPEEVENDVMFPSEVDDPYAEGVTLTEIKKLVSEKKIHLIDGRKALDGEITIQEAIKRGTAKLKEQARKEKMEKFKKMQDASWSTR